MRIGDGIFMIGCWAWMTIMVGPWWVGVTIFVLGYLGNMLHSHLINCPTCRATLTDVMSILKLVK